MGTAAGPRTRRSRCRCGRLSLDDDRRVGGSVFHWTYGPKDWMLTVSHDVRTPSVSSLPPRVRDGTWRSGDVFHVWEPGEDVPLDDLEDLVAAARVLGS